MIIDVPVEKVITNHLQDFKRFLTEKDFLQLSVAFVISQNVQQITQGFVTSVLNPIINRVLGVFVKNKQFLTITILGTSFPLGDLITSLLTFMIILYAFFLIIKTLTPVKVESV